MSDGAFLNYDFESKNKWRVWMWDKLAARVAYPETSEVIYLPGAMNMDRDIAISRGFIPEKMVGVEMNKKTRREIRKKGVLTIDAEFMDAVVATAGSRSVDVVFGDFCGAFDDDSLFKLALAMLSPKFRVTAFAFNFQHGRDPKINKWRQVAENLMKNYEISYRKGEMHRGELFLFSCLACIAYGFERENPLMFTTLLTNMWKLARPECTKYRSLDGQRRGNYFDSVVFRNPFAFCGFNDDWNEYTSDALRRSRKIVPSIDSAFRSAAAVMAHRTMRMN